MPLRPSIGSIVSRTSAEAGSTARTVPRVPTGMKHGVVTVPRAVVIVVAGMEGALPSVVGGLVAAPVIAVPTSVGYGASFGGVAALLGRFAEAGLDFIKTENLYNFDGQPGYSHAQE